jgi:ABC-2 type transport system ATP-binding protein
MITARGLTKTFGAKTAVAGIDFTVEPGRVTGFLGPNGAGKSTTMRMILGLDRPTAGSVTVNGRRYADSPAPLREVGALLEARALHPGRSARDHLRWLAASNAIPAQRVDEVLDLVGLETVADQRVGKFSLGMGQRLGIAVALLGDPPVVVLDEPVNGLDPEGIRWVRTLARQLAQEGRTVFVSSHLMSEMALTADHLVVIGRGRILADCSTSQFIAEHAASFVRVRSPQSGEVAGLLRRYGLDVDVHEDDELRVQGLDPAVIGELVGKDGLFLHELTLVRSSLEDAFMTLTADSVEYSAHHPGRSGDGTPSTTATTSAGIAR